MSQPLRLNLPALGYAVVLAPPSLLVVGVLTDAPTLAFGVLVFFFPLLRPLVGEQIRTPEWSEHATRLLELLPFAHAGSLLAAFGITLHALADGISDPGVGLGLSLWIVMLLSTCPAHELLHRRTRVHRWTGAVVAGLAGYPILGPEHTAHHRRPGDVASAEWPALSENVWQFARRRLPAAVRHACRIDAMARAKRGRPFWQGELAASVTVTASTAMAFGAAGGWQGLLLYVGASAGTAFGVQVITYIQHWGLGFPDEPRASREHIAWEDTCRLQAWLTLHISFHQAHHRAVGLPYYRIHASPGAPQAPAGYVVLMFLALVPSLWGRLMTPALRRWQEGLKEAQPLRRRITCFR
jgi:hypothetical protein